MYLASLKTGTEKIDNIIVLTLSFAACTWICVPRKTFLRAALHSQGTQHILLEFGPLFTCKPFSYLKNE